MRSCWLENWEGSGEGAAGRRRVVLPVCLCRNLSVHGGTGECLGPILQQCSGTAELGVNTVIYSRFAVRLRHRDFGSESSCRCRWRIDVLKFFDQIGIPKLYMDPRQALPNGEEIVS